MPDPHYFFSNLANLDAALAAMEKQHQAKRDAALAELQQEQARCVAIMRHNGKEVVRDEDRLYELLHTHPRRISVSRLAYSSVHDLELPPGLAPKPEGGPHEIEAGGRYLCQGSGLSFDGHEVVVKQVGSRVGQAVCYRADAMPPHELWIKVEYLHPLPPA